MCFSEQETSILFRNLQICPLACSKNLRPSHKAWLRFNGISWQEAGNPDYIDGIGGISPCILARYSSLVAVHSPTSSGSYMCFSSQSLEESFLGKK